MQAVSLVPSLVPSLVALLLAAALTAVTPAPPPIAPQVISCPRAPARDVVATEVPTLSPIELERRFVLPDAPVPAWEQFLYTVDTQPRAAVASELYASSDTRAQVEMMVDEYGGIWAVQTSSVAGRTRGEVTYTRDIWLLPVGSHFRGVISRRPSSTDL